MTKRQFHIALFGGVVLLAAVAMIGYVSIQNHRETVRIEQETERAHQEMKIKRTKERLKIFPWTQPKERKQ